jgi:photosystem II stability/assembly factor-like uncharacterized protein
MKLRFLTIFFFVFVVYTGDGNSQWEEKRGNLPQWNTQGYAMDALDSLTAAVAIMPADPSTTQTLFITRNGGNEWEGINFPEPKWVVNITIVDTNHIWVCTNEPAEILATTDGGITWITQFQAADTLTDYLNYIKMFDLENGIAMGDAPFPPLDKPAVFLRTTNGGEDWIQVNKSFLNAHSRLWYNVDFISPELGFFRPSYDSVFGQSIYKTTDGGSDWQQFNQVHEIVYCIGFRSEQFGFAHLHSCQQNISCIIRTTDGGISWDSTLIIDGSLNSVIGVDFEFLKSDPSRIWFITLDNLYFSQDSGQTWNADPISGNIYRCRDLVTVDDKVCWLLSSSVYRNLNADHITSVYDLPEQPNTFTLHQNYPNPFNPETKIEYEIKQRGVVAIKVHDLLGREVCTLVYIESEPGRYSTHFNGTGLSSGIYFYTMQSGELRVTRSMLLLK